MIKGIEWWIGIAIIGAMMLAGTLDYRDAVHARRALGAQTPSVGAQTP